jgi:choline-sulfatase
MRAHFVALAWLFMLFVCLRDSSQRERARSPRTHEPVLAMSVQPDVSLDDDRLDRLGIDVATPSSQTSEPATRVHYALANHLVHSELRQREAQLFDFGVPGDAKYTLGGWLGRRTETQTLDGRSGLRVRASSLKLQLPADRDDVEQLTLELRSFGPAQLSVFINGKPLSYAALQGTGFESVVVLLPKGVLARGENTLDLRVDTTDPARQLEPGFLLDFIALSDLRLSASELRPPSPRELAPSPHVLRVPEGIRLSYMFQVPAGASFSARVSAATPARMSLRVARDGAIDHALGAWDAAGAPKPIAVDLSAYADQLVRLELVAEQGTLWLDNPSIVSSGASESPLSAHKPIRNVVLYLIDTLRADKLSPYNPNTSVRTPGLSRFLESASVLLRARSQENWTKPSVATLLSSLFPWQHTAATDAAVLPSSVQLLPELLQEHGYFTGAFVANGYVSDKFGFTQGFSSFRNYIREDGRRAVAQTVASDVLAWLDARPQEQPFFLYVHTIDPHVPYRPPQDFLSLYDTEPYAGPVDFAKSSELLEQIKLGQLPLAARDKQRLMALYDGEISYHDVHFDAILAGLQNRGLADDTMVVVTADHGEEFWDHGSVGHGHSLFDELLHVPLLVRLPGVTQRGDRVPADVGLVDVAPTILEALGETPPESMIGRSFLPELLGDTVDAPRASVSGFMEVGRAIAIGRYKLVQHALSRCSLFDTQSDPRETQDIGAEHPLALRYLRGQLGLALADSGERATRNTPIYAAQKTLIDPATEQQLRALGYVGSARH